MHQDLPLFATTPETVPTPPPQPTWTLQDVFDKIEMPLIPVLVAMEMKGIMIDIGVLGDLAKKLQEEQALLTSSIYVHAGKAFNINSTKQLAEILFVNLGIKPGRKSKTGFSTDAATLEKIKDTHPIVADLLNYRQLEKLLSTYIEPMPELINKTTGRLHTSYNQTVTTTGRLSSSKPNLQNIPIRTPMGNEIRKAFVAEEGKTLASLDYSQIELRLVAHVANDPRMIQDFQEGKDIHTATAARLFHCSESEVSKEQRGVAKAINFATIYGAGPRNLAQNAGVSIEEAKSFIDTYFTTYKSVHETIEHMKQKARDNGYAETLFGRRLAIPDIDSSLPQLKASAERIAVNMPFQGTAADLMKLAMIEIYHDIKDSNDCCMLLQVHDELVFEITDNQLDAYLPKLQQAMEQVTPLQVPLTVDVATGTSWGALHDYS